MLSIVSVCVCVCAYLQLKPAVLTTGRIAGLLVAGVDSAVRKEMLHKKGTVSNYVIYPLGARRFARVSRG